MDFVEQQEQARHQTNRFILYYVLKPLVEHCVVLLSALAQAGREDLKQAEGAFQTAAGQLGLGQASISRLDAAECNLSRIDAALQHLAQASPQLKKLVLNACAHAVAIDGVLQSREAELLRAIATLWIVRLRRFWKRRRLDAGTPYCRPYETLSHMRQSFVGPR